MKTHWLTVFTIIIAVILSGCQAGEETQAPSLFGGAELTPFATTTLTPTITSTPYDAPTATHAPTITPTPFIYTVKANDVMFSIAARNGISIESLKAANPDVNPYLLTEGMKLVIPGIQDPAGTQAAPVSTPYPILLSDPNCAPALSGGMYCFANLINEQPLMARNISAEFILTDPASGNTLTRDALVPLNRLPSGGELPLFAYFESPVFANPVVSLRLITATSLEPNGTLTPLQSAVVVVTDPGVVIAPDGLSAVVNPVVIINGAEGLSGRMMVAAVAYDDQNQVVGIRRYESKDAISVGENVTFRLNIYSIGGRIERIEFFGEINP